MMVRAGLLFANPRAEVSPDRFLDDVYRYALARLGQREDAEDVAAETVAALHRVDLARLGEPRLYAIGVARRKVADRLRKRRPEPTYDAEPSVPGPEPDAAWVDGILRRLPDEWREALVLRGVHGFSSREIGEVMGRSPAAVDSLLQRARAAFARMAEEGSDLEETT